MFPWSTPPEPMRFDQFMAAALHHPEHGYYARRIRGVGKSGDFTTTPALTPSFGKAIADWASDALSGERCGNLIELGPGTGALAETVLRHLPWHRRLRTRLHLVETSAPLRKLQQQRLGKRVTWHRSAIDALEACRGEACLYSNEFVDAFPVRRLRFSQGQWLELHLLPTQEIWKPCIEPPETSLTKLPWPEAQIVEVHESYHQWLEELFPAWHRGRLLTVDYGARDRHLYQRQPGGSLRAYFHHQHMSGAEAYARPGHQDLTADVNFSDLIDWPGDRAETVSLLTQADFLRPHVSAGDPADHFASHPDGSGTAFLCLDQRRC